MKLTDLLEVQLLTEAYRRSYDMSEAHKKLPDHQKLETLGDKLVNYMHENNSIGYSSRERRLRMHEIDSLYEPADDDVPGMGAPSYRRGPPGPKHHEPKFSTEGRKKMLALVHACDLANKEGGEFVPYSPDNFMIRFSSPQDADAFEEAAKKLGLNLRSHEGG